MEVIDAQVDWKEGYASDPRFEVLVDEFPSREERVYHSNDDKTLWYSNTGGFVDFYAGHPDRAGDGFGGRSYTLQTSDGEVTLTGPYSSRAGAVNKEGFGPCVDVALTTDPKVMTRGYTFVSGAITLDKARNAADCAGVRLKRVELFDTNEPVWIPTN